MTLLQLLTLDRARTAQAHQQTAEQSQLVAAAKLSDRLRGVFNGRV